MYTHTWVPIVQNDMFQNNVWFLFSRKHLKIIQKMWKTILMLRHLRIVLQISPEVSMLTSKPKPFQVQSSYCGVANGVNTNTVQVLPLWTARCTINWTNELMSATVHSCFSDMLPPICFKFDRWLILAYCTFSVDGWTTLYSSKHAKPVNL